MTLRQFELRFGSNFEKTIEIREIQSRKIGKLYNTFQKKRRKNTLTWNKGKGDLLWLFQSSVKNSIFKKNCQNCLSKNQLFRLFVHENKPKFHFGRNSLFNNNLFFVIFPTFLAYSYKNPIFFSFRIEFYVSIFVLGTAQMILKLKKEPRAIQTTVSTKRRLPPKNATMIM